MGYKKIEIYSAPAKIPEFSNRVTSHHLLVGPSLVCWTDNNYQPPQACSLVGNMFSKTIPVTSPDCEVPIESFFILNPFRIAE